MNIDNDATYGITGHDLRRLQQIVDELHAAAAYKAVGSNNLIDLADMLEAVVRTAENLGYAGACPSCGGEGDHGVEEGTGRLYVCHQCGGTGQSLA